jgi:hypothetical protein
MMTRPNSPFFFALVAALVFIHPTEASSQKLGSKWYEDTELGYKFKPLKDWSATPLPSDRLAAGQILNFNADKAKSVKLAANRRTNLLFSLFAFRLDQPISTTGGNGGGLRGRVKEQTKRPTVEEMIPQFFQVRDFQENLNEPFQEPEEVKITKDFYARHATYRAFSPEGFDTLLDTWTFYFEDYDIAFVWLVPEQYAKKNLKAFEKSMKSLRKIDRKEGARKVAGDGDYNSFLKYQQSLAAKTPGWKVVETPSKDFMLVTSSDDKRFLADVIERLEKSRKLYEKDFPPNTEFDFVSMVRVCASKSEMMKYGNTKGNVAGFFNPGSKELVLYDNQEQNRNETFAVMSHEAFHQYCFFLFEKAEAHRWFDEGQGDYYGGFDMGGKKPKSTAHMPGALDRYPHIKTMVREDNFVPIARLVRMNHEEWYGNNNRYNGIASYAQSWALVYFLRQGMLGKVPSKVWKKEYAQIIPNYTKHLFAGFQETRQALRKEIEEVIRKAGGESAIPKEHLERLNRLRVKDEAKIKIWTKATAESWGKINAEEFQSHWKVYVLKHMK